METIKLAKEIRKSALKMVHRASASHIGSALSIIDIVAVLYGRIMDIDIEDESLIEKKANKLGLKIQIRNSPWIVRNKLKDDILFMKRYILDIKKSLFHMDGIDRTMLRQWHSDKCKSIEQKKIKLLVGHKDILIHKL